MKTLVITFISLVVLSSQAFASDVACTIVTDTGENIAFAKSSEKVDREYKTYEKGSIRGINFYLRAGHGVIRLEARKAGKLVASSWTQSTRTSSGENGTLNLDLGKVEAQCESVREATSN